MAELSLFRSVLGREFERLAPPIQRHYDLQVGQEVTISGHMKSWSRYPFLRPFIPIMPINSERVPVVVRNVGVRVAEGQVGFQWLREFRFPSGTLYSKTLTQHTDPPNANGPYIRDVFAQPPAEITLRLSVEEDGRVLKQITDGPQYARLGTLRLPFPRPFRLTSIALERALNDTGIYSEVTVGHPLLGPMFGYSGELSVQR